MDATLAKFADDRRRLGEVFYFPGIPGPGLQGIFGEIGLEAFSYVPGRLPRYHRRTAGAQHRAGDCLDRASAPAHGIEAGMLGDDMAFKTGPLLRPAWMRKHYFPRLARVIAAHHARGIKVLFHSDGNLNSILGDLVAPGLTG